MQIKRHTINFSKYFSVGVFITILNILFSYIFIDVFEIRALYSSTIIAIFVVLIKYFSYVGIGLIRKKFVIFILITISSAVSYVILATITIDFFKIPTLIAIPSVVLSLFLIRFFAFYWTGIIKN